MYLRIEAIYNYSPVDPHPGGPKPYRRDCMRNEGHEGATVPLAEADARRLSALVYREYLDPGYTIPKPDKLVTADVNEPAFTRRVPGTVIYTRPGERLFIHVFNGDVEPHSLHVHGLGYGIESDGSYPFGTQNSGAQRSDEICPGDEWTYVFDVTAEMVGAWPFHDHYMQLMESVNRGLFGGIVVLPARPRVEPPRLKLPIDLEKLLKELRTPLPLPPVPVPMPPPGMLDGPHLAVGYMGRAHGDIRHRHGGEDAERVRHAAAHGLLSVPDPRIEAVIHGLEEWLHVAYPPGLLRPPAVLHVPLFIHFMVGGGTTAFNSGVLNPGQTFSVSFGAAGTYAYRCSFHPMTGTVNVVGGAPMNMTVEIRDDPPGPRFQPATVNIAPGGTVQWVHNGTVSHTVTDAGGGIASYCLNGRTFVGNTPTILAAAGQRIRWYVFNLDFGMMWHNFHTHGMRWSFAGETIDIRSIGPAESFVVETVAPPAILLPPHIAAAQKNPPKTAKKYAVRGDFLVHCHAEMHMMSGLVGLVRSRQIVYLTPAHKKELEDTVGLPLDDGSNECPDVDLDRCEDRVCGRWERVPGDPPVTFMHALVLANTTKVLFFGYDRSQYAPNPGFEAALFDYTTNAYGPTANQPADLAPAPPDPSWANVWSAGQAHLNTPEGKVLVNGGLTDQERRSFLFNPVTSQWALTGPTAQGRFYPTLLRRSDGRVYNLYGAPLGGLASSAVEVYNPATGAWAAPVALPAVWGYLYYPWTFLLPNGDLFIAGPTGTTRRFNPGAPDPPGLTANTIGGNRSTGGEKGTAVLLPLRPPNYEPRILIMAGNTAATQQTSEIIDLSVPAPAWASGPPLNIPRPEQCTAVLLPDGKVFLAGGVPSAGGPAEILDPRNLAAGWAMCAEMTYARGYHSAAVLLPDGSVLMGGDPPWAGRRPHERFYPPYFDLPRPVINAAPANIAYGANFNVTTPDPASIAEAVLVHPAAATHGFDQGQRLTACAVAPTGPNTLRVTAPPNGNVAPPGWCMLFLVNAGRVPSVAKWVRLQ